jgi:hypothetical protein
MALMLNWHLETVRLLPKLTIAIAANEIFNMRQFYHGSKILAVNKSQPLIQPNVLSYNTNFDS